MFDKKKCLSNIYSLVKKRKKNIGDVELTAEVSRGYLSRINNENSTNPPIEMLCSMAEQLNVSLDQLVNGDFEHLSVKEQYVYDFVHKLVKMTEKGTLDWVRERVSKEMNCQEPYYSNDNGRINVYFYPEFVDNFVLAEDAVYVARLPQSYDSVMMLNLNYNYQLPEGDTDYFEAIEIYTVDRDGNCHPVCNSSLTVKELKEEIEELNSYVFGARSRLSLNEIAKGTINNFMENIDDDGKTKSNNIMDGFMNIDDNSDMTDGDVDEELPFT